MSSLSKNLPTMIEKPDDLTLEECQEAFAMFRIQRKVQQCIELIMKSEGLWHIRDQIFGPLNHETLENCRKVSESWNESLQRMALVKYLEEFGESLRIRALLRNFEREDENGEEVSAIIRIPEWNKAVKDYGAKSSIEDLQEIKDSLGELLDVTGKWKSARLQPAHQAAEIGALKLLEFFLSIPYDMNSHDYIQSTVFSVACENGQIECVKLLIDATSDLNARDIHGHTAFHWACRRGQAETVKFLIEVSTKYGIDLNARDNDGITALNWACQDPDTDETAKMMIELSTK